MKNSTPLGLIFGLFLLITLPLKGRGADLSDNAFQQLQFEISVAPGYNHVPLRIPFPVGLKVNNVESSKDWATPRLDQEKGELVVELSTATMAENSNATLTVLHQQGSQELFVFATVSPLNILRLTDDPKRPLIYGIQRNGGQLGCVVRYNYIENRPLDCLTVGKGPTDFVRDETGNELLVINNESRRIDVIDLEKFEIKTQYLLSNFGTWGNHSPGAVSANIELGPGGTVYYVDSAWGPVLHVLDRATGQVTQSLAFDGAAPSNDTGFMDIGLLADQSTMIAIPQYGWTAGSHSAIVSSFSLSSEGLVTPQKTVRAASAEVLQRHPFEAPVLVSKDGRIAISKTVAVNPSEMDKITTTFPDAIWSMTPNAELVATSDSIYDFQTGLRLLKFETKINASFSQANEVAAQVFTSDYRKFIYFNPDTKELKSIDLFKELERFPLGGIVSPKDGAVLQRPTKLSWYPVLGGEEYDVYIGFSKVKVEQADPSSSEYLGRVRGTELDLVNGLETGRTYYWRVDPVTIFNSPPGYLYKFTVSSVDLTPSSLNLIALQGMSQLETKLNISSSVSHNWEISSATDWITIPISNGTTPGNPSIVMKSADLPVGVHTGNIVLKTAGETLSVPVELKVVPSSITHLRSDRNSKLVYGISEVEDQPAYLFELDTETESILRVVEVGSSVTDLAIHDADNRIYIPNWIPGSLLAIDRSTFKIVRIYPFNPYRPYGNSGDIHQVAAAGPGRLVIESGHNYGHIQLFDTSSGEILSQYHTRMGGGEVTLDGRYYIHGDQGTSDARLVRYDLAGDIVKQLQVVRPELLKGYGDRNVIIPETGSYVFWANSVFEKDLSEIWNIGDIILTATPTGRYAMSRTKVYDLLRREAVLTMPSNLTATVYNSTSKKLIAATSGFLDFYPLTENAFLTLPVPVLSATIQNHVDVVLYWLDQSLESEFHIETKKAGDLSWQTLPVVPANQTRYVVAGLEEETEYLFRIRAVSGVFRSEWSEPLSIVPSLVPPPAPRAWIETINPADMVIAWLRLVADLVYVEYKSTSSSGEVSWLDIGSIDASSQSGRIEGLRPDTFYEFRLRSERDGLFSDYSFTSGTTLSLPLPSSPVFSDIIPQGPGVLWLEWEQVSYADELVLYVRELGETDYTEVVTLGGHRRSYVHEDLDPQKFYEYVLQAINAAGDVISNRTFPISSSVDVLFMDDFDTGPRPDVWDLLVGVRNDSGGPQDSTSAQFFSGSLRAMETVPLDLSTITAIEFDMRLPSFFDDDQTWWPTPNESFVFIEIHDGIRWAPLEHLSTSVSLPGWRHYRYSFNPINAIGNTRIRWIQRGNDPVGNQWALDNVKVIVQPHLPPAIPSSVTMGATDDGRYVVFWLKSDRATTYVVERLLNGENTWEIVGTTTELSIIDPMLHNGASVAYRVTANSASGLSSPSDPVWTHTGIGSGGELPETVLVGGRVFFMGGSKRPIPQVTVILSQDGTELQTKTNAQGQYLFEVPMGKPVEVRAEMMNALHPNRGVDVADIINLRKHILNRHRFAVPEEWVAADVNRDQSVDVSDIVQMRKVILNRDDAFSRDKHGNKHSVWRLVCADFTRINPESAFNEMSKFSVCRFDQLEADITNADFAAIKLGDSNGDWALEENVTP